MLLVNLEILSFTSEHIYNALRVLWTCICHICHTLSGRVMGLEFMALRNPCNPVKDLVE